MRLVLVLILALAAIICAKQNAITAKELSCFKECRKQQFPTAACSTLCFSEMDETESDAESAPISSKFIWESYTSELFSFLKRGGDSKGVQLLRTPIVADWHLNTETLSNLCNNQSHWGVERLPSGKKIPIEYAKFLQNIKVNKSIDPTVQQKVETINANIATLKKTIESETVLCKERHERWVRLRGPIAYEEFEQRQCNRIGSTHELLTVAEVELAQLLRQIPGADVLAAISEFEKAENYNWIESFVQKLSLFISKIELNRADSFGITVTKTSLSQRKTSQEWSWESLEKDKDNDFISTSGKGSVHTFTTSADNFKMEIRSEGYYSIEVAPGKWLDQNVLKKYAKGPFVNPNVSYFGKNGPLSMLVKRVYLLYKPVVHLYLSDGDAQYLKRVSQTSTTIKLGPFETDSNTLKVEEVKDSSLFKVTLAANNELPVVVAVENAFL